jgi:ankyrin repeat protein
MKKKNHNFFIFLLLTIVIILSGEDAFSLDDSDILLDRVFMTAVKKSNYSKVEEMLDQDVAINYKDSENLVALAYALENDDKRMFKLLIDNGADPKVKILNKNSLLIFYVVKNRYLLIDDIIKSGVDINSQDKMGMTALMHSIEKINLNAVNVLAMKDFDREKTDFAGKTIFDYSNLSRNTIIRKIIETLNPTN